MKIAWICYKHANDDYYDGEYNPLDAVIEFEEPPEWRYAKVVKIVYSEIVE
jgi:hypothetical protein